MGLIRVRDFAKECGCTPQNIYKHIRNHATEMEGHVLDSTRGMLLDEFACDFIREAMYPRELDAESEVTKMTQDLAELRAAFMKLGQENLRISSELLQTQGERDRAVLELQHQRKLLQAAEDDNELTRQKAAAAEQEKKLLEQKVTEIKAQNAALGAEKDEAKEKARLEAEAAQKAAEGLRRAEEEKVAWKEYAAALEAYNALGWFKRRRAEKPVPPAYVTLEERG